MTNHDTHSPLATEKISKLMLKMAIPSVVAQLVNLLYNIVDRIYIGHMEGIGKLALTGVGICMPMIMLMNAFAMLVSAGGASSAHAGMAASRSSRSSQRFMVFPLSIGVDAYIIQHPAASGKSFQQKEKSGHCTRTCMAEAYSLTRCH